MGSLKSDQIVELASCARSREHLRLILDHVPFGIWLQNAQGRMEFVNRWYCEAVGVSEETFLGVAHYRELYPPEIAESCMLSDAEAMGHNGPCKSQETVLFTDGKEHVLEITKLRILNAAGEIDGLLGIAEDMTESLKAQQRVYQLAYYDELTGLPNRSWLKQQMSQWLQSNANGDATGQQTFYAFVLFDVDQFKTLNDTQGHAAGDQLLIELVRRLQKQLHYCLDKAQLVALMGKPVLVRLGSDEFAMLLRCQASDRSEAQALLHHQLSCMQAKIATPFRLSLQVLDEMQQSLHRATVTFGVKLFRADSIGGIDELLKKAEIALYQGKARGANQLLFFTNAMQDEVDNQSELVNQLNFAIARDELSLHFQPVMNQAGQVVGAEALLRWHNHKLGRIGPDRFIPVAEQTGLIYSLSDWVLHSAMSTLSFWQREPHLAPLMLAVNISAKQFHREDFVDQLQHLIDFYQVDAGKLKLELTESVMLESLQLSVEKMCQLRKMGLYLSIDDFGTGFASLSYLKRLPIHEIKIDRSFVNDLPNDQDDAQIVSAILRMAQALNLSVVAEGVETGEQLAFLLAQQTGYFQGYYFSQPLEEQAFVAFIAQAEQGVQPSD